MEEARFWLHIEHLRSEAEGAIPRMRVLLARDLERMSDRELAGFADNYLAARDHAHCWPLADAVTVAFGYYGDDAFSDVQNWLICQGELVYRQILTDPDVIAEFLGDTGEAAFSEAELLDMTVHEELGLRPAAAKMVEYQSNRALPWGARSELADPAVVQARYPRCAAIREKYLNSQLPSIAVPAADSERTKPTRNLALGATWLSRRR